MNYIVLDLEWNQSASGKKFAVEKMPFEIIQIGAVKLDASFQEIDSFEELIRPNVYKKMHSKCQEITGLTQEMLANGKHFVDVASDFLEWCGKDFCFCTWGAMDLVELQRNLAYYEMTAGFPMPFLFYDVQKLYSLQYLDGKERPALSTAIETLGIPESEQYHLALSDARYTGKVLSNIDMNLFGSFYSIDTYVIPQNRKQEIYMDFGSYQKYISKGFVSREKAAADRRVRSCNCPCCGNPMVRKIKWFSAGKSYYGLFICEKHGYVKGRFRIKQTDDGAYFAIKILKMTDEQGAEKIAQRQEREREHRRQKRLHASEAKEQANKATGKS